jgi:hypothetical protein
MWSYILVPHSEYLNDVADTTQAIMTLRSIAINTTSTISDHFSSAITLSYVYTIVAQPSTHNAKFSKANHPAHTTRQYAPNATA